MSRKKVILLNRPLYLALRKRFGRVILVNEDAWRVEDRGSDGMTYTISAGESYSVNCPFCHDTKFRLSISYRWLNVDNWTGRLNTCLINCYNEHCADVYSSDFYDPVYEDMEWAKSGVLDSYLDVSTCSVSGSSDKVVHKAMFPNNLIPISDLGREHRAICFLNQHYTGLAVISNLERYLYDNYSVYFTDNPGEYCLAAANRIIFPIHDLDGNCVSWQGRSVDASCTKRWYMAPGTAKFLYNGYRIMPHETPIICEGITSSIACGPLAIAIFGKSLSDDLAQQFVAKGWRSAIIALDPETFIPDNRDGCKGHIDARKLEAKLKSIGIIDIRKISYPDDVMKLAERHNNKEKINVPDPADLGFYKMLDLIKKVS